MKFKFLIPLVVFIGLAIMLGVGLTLNPRELPSALINKTAPEFRLALLSEPRSQFAPSDYMGQRWILNVWASWCVACRIEHPLLNELASKTRRCVLTWIRAHCGHDGNKEADGCIGKESDHNGTDANNTDCKKLN